jgi:Lipid A 3-O-deacylase (PagL)
LPVLKSGVVSLRPVLRIRLLSLILALVFITTLAIAQSPEAGPYVSRKNTFSVIAAYSNDSSHILLGYTENRKLLDIGVGYDRRLLVGRAGSLQYSAEILPVALESDPVVLNVTHYTSPFVLTTSSTFAPLLACKPESGSYTQTGNGITTSFTYTNTCTRQWTMGEAMSPIGFQWNLLPRIKTQPFITAHGGYMFSTQPIPVSTAGSFNFTFDMGAGIELYRSKTQSIRAEYRFHHISNHNTANRNPGIDSGLLQVTYSFGR